MTNENKEKIILFIPLYHTEECRKRFIRYIKKYFIKDGRYEIAGIECDGNLDSENTFFKFKLLADYIDEKKIG